MSRPSDPHAPRRRVTRRGFLQAAAIAAGTAMVPGRLLFGCGASSRIEGSEGAPPAGVEQRTLHFNLSHVPSPGEFTLHLGHRAIPLVRHDRESLARHRDRSQLLSQLPDEVLSHHVADLHLPTNAPQSYSIIHRPNGRHLPVLALAGVHIPRAGWLAARKIKGPGWLLHLRKFRRLAELYLGQQALAATPDDTTVDDITAIVDTYDAARFAVFHHPELITLDATTAALVAGAIDTQASLDALALAIARAGQAQPVDSPYSGWAYGEWSLDFDGERIPRLDIDGNPITDEFGNIEYEFDYVQADEVVTSLGPAVKDTLIEVRNDEDLETLGKYNISTGIHAVDVVQTVAAAPQATSGTQAIFDRDGEWRYGQRVTRTTWDGSTLGFDVDNHFLRHLGVHVAYADVDGKPVELTNLGLDRTAADTDYVKFLGMLEPPPRILGIPVVGHTYTSGSFSASLPAGASQMIVMTSSLACGPGSRDPELKGISAAAEAMTIIFELGVPVLLLGVGVAGTIAESAIKGLIVNIGTTVVTIGLEILAAHEFEVESEGMTSFALTFVNTILKKLVGGTAALFYAGLAAAEAAASAEKLLPIVGWACYAVDVAVTTAELVNTIADIFLARRRVRSDVRFVHDIHVVILPDPNDYQFPAVGTEWRVTLLFSEATARTFSTALGDPRVPALDTVFTGVPRGGTVDVLVQVLSETGWIAAQADAKAVVNVTPQGSERLEVVLTLTENPVPLEASTVYSPRASLETVNGQHVWLLDPPAPTATVRDLDCGPTGAALCEPVDLTFAGKLGQVGLAWRALTPDLPSCASGVTGTQLYQAQNLNLNGSISNGAPDGRLKRLPCGHDVPALLAYDLTGPEDGLHFVIAPNADGVYHARRVRLDATTPFDTATAPSWGWFVSERLAAATVHPTGYVVVLNADRNKVEVLRLEGAFANDADAPRADVLSGPGDQMGNILGGRAIAATLTGRTFLVLEAVNRRIQALDDHGQPVTDYFKPGSGPSWFAPLASDGTTTVTFLDMTVEPTGYIFILSYEGNGALVSDYRLDVYQPNGEHLFRQRGFAAASLAVDPWRILYSLDYRRIVSPAGVTEPGVTQWIPSTPTP